MSPVCYVDFDPEQFQPPLPFRVRLEQDVASGRLTRQDADDGPERPKDPALKSRERRARLKARAAAQEACA